MSRWSEALGEAMQKGDVPQIALCILSHPSSKGLKRETVLEVFDWSLGVPATEHGRKMLKTMAEAMLAEEL